VAEPVAELVLTEPEAVPVAEPEAPFAYGAQISLLTVTVARGLVIIQILLFPLQMIEIRTRDIS